MHHKLVFLSIITLLAITIVSFQNCARKGSGIKPLVTPDPPPLIIGTIVASWYEKSRIVEGSSPDSSLTRVKIQEAKSYMSEPIPNNRFESHLHPIDVGTEVTLEFQTSDKTLNHFLWSIQKGFKVITVAELTKRPKYHYRFEEPGIYDVSVQALGHDLATLKSSANKKLIVGQCGSELNNVPILEIISDSHFLAPGKSVTLSLQDTTVDARFFPDPTPNPLQYNDLTEIQWKVTIPYSDTCKGLCTKIGKGPERIEKTGESITVDIPKEDISRFVASHIEVEVTAKVNPTNPNESVGIGSDGQQIEQTEEPLPACITYRKKDFKVDDPPQSQFIAVKPIVQTEHEMVCALTSPPSCDSSPEWRLEHLSLENNDIYRYRRNTNGLQNQVVIDASHVIALVNAPCEDCSYKITYQHNLQTKEGSLSCDSRRSSFSETLNVCPLPFILPPRLILDSNQACSEALITITAGQKEKTYYNYCPESDNEFGICYFGPVDHRPESHKCSSSSSPPPSSTTTTTTTTN